MKEEEIEGCTGGCTSCAGCGHDHEEAYVPDELDPIVTLTDEDGNEVKFEILDVVVVDEKEFLVVAEVEEQEGDDVEVTILEIKEEDGEEVYDTLVDEKLAERVFKEFTKQQEEQQDEE
ncbi:MAG: DUF1292 domain-containing protein [Clostridia bacterium]